MRISTCDIGKFGHVSYVLSVHRYNDKNNVVKINDTIIKIMSLKPAIPDCGDDEEVAKGDNETD